MAESNKLEYLINAWNVGITDYPITLTGMLNPNKDFAVNFFFKCFTIYRQLLFPEAPELNIPEEKRLPMAVKFINDILNGKYKVGYMDLLRPNKTTAFCFKFALNFILHSQRAVPQIKSLETEVRSQVVMIKDEIQHYKTDLNQLCVSREILCDKIKARKKELESVNVEYNQSKLEFSEFQIEERNTKESIQQLCNLISQNQIIMQKLEAATEEKAKLYSCISNWDKLLGEFNRLEEEKKHFEESDVSVCEALQEKHKCLHNFELIIDSLQKLKARLENFSTTYPTVKKCYDNQAKEYDEKLKELEMNEANTQKLIDDINACDDAVIKKDKEKIAELKTYLTELEKKKFATLQRNEELKRDNDYNIKVFIASMKECEYLEMEMQKRYDDAVRVFEEKSNCLNCVVKKVINAFAENYVH